MCYPSVINIWFAINKKWLDAIDVDLVTIVQTTQRFIVNFKSVSVVLLETLSGSPNLPIFDVHLTPSLSG
jgi:hypothetical protein